MGIWGIGVLTFCTFGIFNRWQNVLGKTGKRDQEYDFRETMCREKGLSRNRHVEKLQRRENELSNKICREIGPESCRMPNPSCLGSKCQNSFCQKFKMAKIKMQNP